MRAKLTEKLIKALRPKAKRYDVYDEIFPGLLLRVETGATKTYYLKYRTATRAQHMLKLGRTTDIALAEAREEGKRKRGEIALGKDPALERSKQRQGLTLETFLDDGYEAWLSENTRWGQSVVKHIRRVYKDLLGIRIGTTTVKNILRGSGVYPAPDKAFKKPAVPWTTFVHAHMETMVACDFFTKRIYTLRGVLTAHVLVFSHMGSRRVYCSPATHNPTGDWLMQQARNANMWLDDMGVKPRFVIHDRDRKYPDEFKFFWKSEGVRCIRIPLKAPRANSFCKSFIETLKREVLNYFMCFSLDQLDYILSVWLRHYHHERPHRGVGRDNTVLDKNFVPQTEGCVRCRSELGGIVKSYYREAA